MTWFGYPHLPANPGLFNDRRPHVVYELWLRGECQYVGLTVSLARRLKEHRPRIAWDEVRTTEVGSQLSAEGLEARLIFALRPPHNRRWNPNHERGIGSRCYPLRTLAAALGP